MLQEKIKFYTWALKDHFPSLRSDILRGIAADAYDSFLIGSITGGEYAQLKTMFNF